MIAAKAINANLLLIFIFHWLKFKIQAINEETHNQKK